MMDDSCATSDVPCFTQEKPMSRFNPWVYRGLSLQTAGQNESHFDSQGQLCCTTSLEVMVCKGNSPKYPNFSMWCIAKEFRQIYFPTSWKARFIDIHPGQGPIIPSLEIITYYTVLPHYTSALYRWRCHSQRTRHNCHVSAGEEVVGPKEGVET